MGKICGYARVSSKEQTRGYSLQNQIERLRAAGCEEIFSDVESAYKRGTDRPEFERLMALVKSGQVEQIIITDLHRLARNEAVSFGCFDDFDEAGVRLLSLDQPYLDLSNPDGRVIAGYSVLEARAYSARLSRRVKQGHKAHRDRNAAYFPPFGYVKVKEKFELDTTPLLCLISSKTELSRAQIGRDLIEIFLSNRSLRKTLGAINSKYGIYSYALPGKGNKHPRGKFHFNVPGFASWLNNPILRGHIAYGRGRKQRQSHKHLWDIRLNTHPEHVLMSEEEYRTIETILDANAAGGGFSFQGLVHPLSGLIYCDDCRGRARITGFRLRSDRSVRKYSYQCNNWQFKSCAQKKCVRLEIIEELVIGALLQRVEQLAQEATTVQVEMEPPELIQLRQKLSGLEQMLQSMGDDAALRGAASSIQSQIDNFLIQQRLSKKSDRLDRELLISTFSDPDYWLTLLPTEKRDIYRALVDRVTIRDGAVVKVLLKV